MESPYRNAYLRRSINKNSKNNFKVHNNGSIEAEDIDKDDELKKKAELSNSITIGINRIAFDEVKLSNFLKYPIYKAKAVINKRCSVLSVQELEEISQKLKNYKGC